MTQRTRRLLCIGVLVCAVAASCTDMDAATSNAPPLGEPASQERAAEPREWLFSVQADAPSNYTDGSLVMPASSVMAFTDRPHRDSRVISLESLASLWDLDGPDSFRDDPPNAVLTYWDGTGPDARPRSVVCEVNGDVSTIDGPSGRSLSMGITVLEPEGAQLPATLQRAALFIDDLPGGCASTPEDEEIVEFANMEAFEDLISVTSQAAAGGGSELALTCDDAEPAPDGLQILLGDVNDAAYQIECNRWTPWTLTAAHLQGSEMCTAGLCTMPITVRNATTLTVFSTTQVVFRPSTGAPTTIVPELDPATLPICPLIADDAPTAPEPEGTLELCDGPASCNAG